MVTPAGWRSDVLTRDFDPGVSHGRACLVREPDHQLRLVALLAQQPIEDQTGHQAAGPERADPQHGGYRAPQPCRLMPPLPRSGGASQDADEIGKGMTGHQRPDHDERGEDPDGRPHATGDAAGATHVARPTATIMSMAPSSARRVSGRRMLHTGTVSARARVAVKHWAGPSRVGVFSAAAKVVFR